MKFDPDLKAMAPWVAAFGVMPETRITTPTGPRAARDLKIGDLVNTRDDGPQPLTNAREVHSAPAERNHFAVHIAKGALGFGLPHNTLQLGPQHRVLFQHIRVPLMFGTDAVLVRAKSLVMSHDGIEVERGLFPAMYTQLSLATQGIIFAEGVPIETVQQDGDCDLDYMTVRSWELRTAVA